MADPWTVEVHTDSAQALHDLEVPHPARPTVWICEPVRPAFVLGSTQRGLQVDDTALEAAGIDLVRRRSGGGVVLLDPAVSVWVDLLLPRDHPLWDDDVGRAMHWVGDAWVAALRAVGVQGRVHRGRLDQGRWGRLVCAAGLGPGEVVDEAGRKLVGISQRRTRHVARFQTLAELARPTADLADLLGLPAPEAAALQAELAATTATVPVERGALIDALLAALPR